MPAKGKKKGKKRLVNEAQSIVLDPKMQEDYLDALFERHVSAVDPKGEYRSNIPELKLDEYFERFKDLLKAQYGNPDQIDMFLATRHWLNNDKWKGESFKYKEMNWREQIMKDFEEWDKKQGEVADALRAQKIVE